MQQTLLDQSKVRAGFYPLNPFGPELGDNQTCYWDLQHAEWWQRLALVLAALARWDNEADFSLAFRGRAINSVGGGGKKSLFNHPLACIMLAQKVFQRDYLTGNKKCGHEYFRSTRHKKHSGLL